MIWFLLITAIVLLILLLIVINRRKKDKTLPKSYLDELEKTLNSVGPYAEINELTKLLSIKGTDKDEIPEGIGEFGLEKTNPIPVNGITSAQFYLNLLRTTDNKTIKFVRKGSVDVDNISQPVDIYEVFPFDDEEDNEFLYISIYHKRRSEKAPKGFYIVGKELEVATKSNKDTSKIFARDLNVVIDRVYEKSFKKFLTGVHKDGNINYMIEFTVFTMPFINQFLGKNNVPVEVGRGLSALLAKKYDSQITSLGFADFNEFFQTRYPLYNRWYEKNWGKISDVSDLYYPLVEKPLAKQTFSLYDLRSNSNLMIYLNGLFKSLDEILIMLKDRNPIIPKNI
jgi:hypothetical protein